MNNHFKFLVAVFSIFWTFSTISFASPCAEYSTRVVSEPDKFGLPCNEPAPTNYHVSDIRTTEIWVAWDAPASNPSEYNIKIYETSTGNLVNEYDIPGTQHTARAGNLQPGTEYTIKNTPKCNDGTLSNFFVSTTATTLIVDLVVSGFSAPLNSAECFINANEQFCYADPEEGTIVKFKIRPINNQTQGRFFGIYNVGNNCQYTTVKVRPEDAASRYKFYCNSESEPVGPGNPTCQGGFVSIKYNDDLIATFGISDPSTGTKKLVWVGAYSGFEIVRYGDGTGESDNTQYSYCGAPPPGNRPSNVLHREEDIWEDIPSSTTLSANPNPFTNQLDIQIPFANINETVELNLYDLQGRRVINMRTPGDQQTIALSTEDLSPGMYFLRAESGGIVQTIKVVKTQ